MTRRWRVPKLTETPELEAFGRELRRAREESGLSLRALAEAVAASHTVVSDWERGRHAPRPPRVRMLEHVLQLAPGSLSRLLGYLPPGDIEKGAVGVLQAAQSDPRLTDRDRRILAAVYRELVRKNEETPGP